MAGSKARSSSRASRRVSSQARAYLSRTSFRRDAKRRPEPMPDYRGYRGIGLLGGKFFYVFQISNTLSVITFAHGMHGIL